MRGGARSTQFELTVHTAGFHSGPHPYKDSPDSIDEHTCDRYRRARDRPCPSTSERERECRGAVVPTLSRHLICMYILVHPFRRASCIRLAVKCLGSTPVKLACPPYLARTQRPKSAGCVKSTCERPRHGPRRVIYLSTGDSETQSRLSRNLARARLGYITTIVLHAIGMRF